MFWFLYFILAENFMEALIPTSFSYSAGCDTQISSKLAGVLV